MIVVPVATPSRHYDVLVGPGTRHQLGEVLPPEARRAAIVTQAAVPVEVDPGVENRKFIVPRGEHAKTLAAVEALCRDLAEWGFTRSDVVVGVGGGVVTDLAGFVAAVYLRGVQVVHVATTLLAQVDAAIGGKTGVNLPEGKNLVGAFWQPSAVICDTEVLTTLPPREYRSGLGEVAKYHFLGEEWPEQDPIEQRVARCVALKAALVAADERETGGRAVLNYGHTLAHALEAAGEYDLRHGEAVAIGLRFAAELAHELGRINGERVDQHRQVLAGYDLPADLPNASRIDRLVELMRRDKKARSGLTFVLDGPAGVEELDDVSEDAVAAVLSAMGAK